MKHYWLVIKVKNPEILESVKALAKKTNTKIIVERTRICGCETAL